MAPYSIEIWPFLNFFCSFWVLISLKKIFLVLSWQKYSILVKWYPIKCCKFKKLSLSPSHLGLVHIWEQEVRVHSSTSTGKTKTNKTAMTTAAVGCYSSNQLGEKWLCEIPSHSIYAWELFSTTSIC